MSTQRWTFTEVATGDTYTVPINPDSMTSPYPERQLATAFGYWDRNRLRSFQTPSPAKEWQFGGALRTWSHHEDLRVWSKKSGVVNVTDHLGRTFAVLFTSFEATDRPPTPSTPFRARYNMSALVLRRIA